MRVFLALWVLPGCIRGTVNRFTTGSVVPYAASIGDVDRVCRTGGGLGYALGPVAKKTPHHAMVIADVTAALCDETAADEAALDVLLAQSVPAIKDAKERERRLRSRAALRFFSGWEHANAAFGPLGESCPKIAAKDELTLLVGLMGGTLAMLNDKASGGAHDVPLDTLNRVGRAAPCVDGWWSVPEAFQAAAWAAVPGSGPEGVDPWQRMRAAAEAGDDDGVRLGWALLAVMAENAGEEEVLEQALEGARQSFEATPHNPAFAMFDAYAFQLLQNRADRIWIEQRGHRSAGLALPVDAAVPEPAGPDPFADDPFAEPEPDPFAEETP